MSLLMTDENGEVGEYGPVNPEDSVQAILDKLSENDKSQICNHINNFINSTSEFTSAKSFGEPEKDWKETSLMKILEYTGKDRELTSSVLDYFIQTTLKDINEYEWVCCNKSWAEKNGEEISYWPREVCSKAA